MKKFFVTLFILIILAGAVFFFGWAQLTVPPGAYGIVQSKTHGIDEKIIQSGEFRWIWYKLVPTNVEVKVFRIAAQRRTIKMQNTLPSGAVYAAFTGTQPDFTWELDGTFSFSLKPEQLPALLREKNITNQEALDQWQQELSAQIEAYILSHLNAADMPPQKIEELLKNGGSPAFESEICAAFPQVENFSLTISRARFPDFALYQQIKALYEEYLAKQKEQLTLAINAQAKDRITSQIHFDELERYGELLAKYPMLLDYLMLEKGIAPQKNQKTQ